MNYFDQGSLLKSKSYYPSLDSLSHAFLGVKHLAALFCDNHYKKVLSPGIIKALCSLTLVAGLYQTDLPVIMGRIQMKGAARQYVGKG
jgi:hypothetical protein